MVLTIKAAIKNALSDLRKNNFLKFCHQLLDRREEPCVSVSDVERKSLLQITDLLVSTFTETKALQVTLDTLRQINCNQEAETLYSKTRICFDKGDPIFRKTSTGELETKRSQEASNQAASNQAVRWSRSQASCWKKPEEVEAEAKASVVSEGGDPRIEKLVLSRFKIQFGQYKGQTFKWLLENDLSWVVFLVASHQKEQEDSMSREPLMVHKDSLTQYAIAYPEVLKEVRFQNKYKQSLESRQKGKALIGFRPFPSETLKDLYDSKDEQKIRFVDFLRSMKSKCIPESKMDKAVKYILQRDQRRAKAAATKRQKSQKRVQPSSASGTAQKRRKRS